MKIQKRKGKCKQVLAILILGIVCMMSGRMQGGVVQAATEGDFIYSVNEDETMVTITEYTGSGSTVEIPETIDGKSVTSIGDWAFSGCSGITSITIPSSVTSIGSWAFSGCSGLNTIYADADSFAATWATKNGYTVKPITTDTPTDDKKPTDNPNTPTDDTKPTDNPNTPTDDTKPTDNPNTPTDDKKPTDNPNTPSGEDSTPTATPAAKGKTLTSKSKQCKVKVTSSSKKNPTVTYVKTTNTKATSVTVPDTVEIDNVIYKVTSVADKAFSGNNKIKTVNIGKNVTSIGKDAFKNCSKLKTVNIQSTSFKKIGATAFSGCKNLTKITLKSTNLTKSSVGKNALKGTNKKLVIKVPQNKVKVYKNYFKNKGNTKLTVKK